MNVLNKFGVLVLVGLYFFVGVGFAFNVCNVDISEPWFDVKDKSGQDVLIVDSQGDIYFEGKDHYKINYNNYDSLIFGNLHFNLVTSKFTNFIYGLNVLPNKNGLIVRDKLGDDVSLFTEVGNIYTKGKGVYNNSQAGCLDDGKYCQGNFLETRDYFCTLTGSKSGFCSYRVSSSENCLNRVSLDEDGGVKQWVKSAVRDYVGCVGHDCSYDSKVDYCSSSTVLKEYISSGNSFSTVDVNCRDNDYYFCAGSSNLNRYKKIYGCSDGACAFSRDLFIESCKNNPIYSSWSCSGYLARSRAETTFKDTCSASGCGSSGTTVTNTVSAPSGKYCLSGSWKTITYHFVYGSYGSCLGSCGSSSGTRTRSVKCIRDYDGATVSNSYCGSPVTSKSCSKVAYPDSWRMGSYGVCYFNDNYPACSTSGVKMRSVTCSGSCCNPNTEPSNVKSCTGSYSSKAWTVGSWSACSTSSSWSGWSGCSGGTMTRTCSQPTGTQTRSVTCNACLCSGSKPAIWQYCTPSYCSGSSSQNCCIPKTSVNCGWHACGTWDDGCGGSYYCGGCPGSHSDCHNRAFKYGSYNDLSKPGYCDQGLSGGK